MAKKRGFSNLEVCFYTFVHFTLDCLYLILKQIITADVNTYDFNRDH